MFHTAFAWLCSSNIIFNKYNLLLFRVPVFFVVAIILILFIIHCTVNLFNRAMTGLKLKLIATPLSHYARKVRILLDLYKIPYDFQDIVGNIALTQTPIEVGGNPLMKVPVLQHGSEWIIESDHIASYLVSQFDSKDIYKVNSKVIFDLNTRAMLNGMMNEELKVIVARRHQVPTDQFTYFKKAQNAVDNGLDWLEANHTKFEIKSPNYREFHLISCWDHFEYYDFVPNMADKYPRLRDIVGRVTEELPIIKLTAPHTVAPKTPKV